MTDEQIKQMWVDAWLEQGTGVEPDEEETKALKSFLAKAKPIIETQLRAELNAEIRIELGSKAFEKGKKQERERIAKMLMNPAISTSEVYKILKGE